LGAPIASVKSLACTLVGRRALSRAAGSRFGFPTVGWPA